MAIGIFSEDVSVPDFDQKLLEKTLEHLIVNEGYVSGEVNIIYCSDEHLLQMNKDYLNHDYYTDIITFDYVDDQTVSGDLFISLDRIKENASQFADSLDQELFRVMIHGVLHLCGYHDKSEEEQQTMRGKENEYLKYAGKLAD